MFKLIHAGIEAYHVLNTSPLFDKQYYSKRYHVPACMSVVYDLLIGRVYANDPSEEFSAKKYYETYPDVKASKQPALYHYLKHGKYEGRIYEDTNPLFVQCPILRLFDGTWYADEYLNKEDLRENKPLKHYLLHGWKQKLKPFFDFDIERFYLENPSCNEEPLSYWYKKRLPTLYFVDYVRMAYSNNARWHKALQYLYHFDQDAFAKKVLEKNAEQQDLRVFFAPNPDQLSLGEVLSFQKAYLNARQENDYIVVLTAPGISTYTGAGIFSDEIRIMRYSQLTYRMQNYRHITFVLSDIQLPLLIEYLKNNTDDPIHLIRSKNLEILDFGRINDLKKYEIQISEIFDHFSYKNLELESPETNPYLGFFDAIWYRKSYITEEYREVDPLWHYLNIGWREQFRPFEFFDIERFYHENPKCMEEPLYYLYKNRIGKYYFTEHAVPKMNFDEKAGQALQVLYKIRQENLISTELPFYNDINRLMIILVSPEDAISGGIMSFYGIYHLSKELESVHNRKVIAATIPGDTTHAGFTMFKNDMPVFRYDMVARRLCKVNDVLVMVPETYVQTYYQYLSSNTDDPILDINNRHLNIMNQKIEIMPEPGVINDMKRFFPYITQTVAHYKYCTAYEREYYGIPMHLLIPPIIKNFKLVPYEKKENIFAYSYDSQRWKNKMLHILQTEFPDLRFIEIKNMLFDEYIDLIQRAKWCMTFGEGLDGYFSEPYQTGGISFAVWNDDYFTERYRALPTVLPNVETALKELPALMRALDKKDEYEKVSALVRSVHGEEYSTQRTPKAQLEDFFNGKYDYP